MLSYLWPLVLVIVSNTVYNICTKSTPPEYPALCLTDDDLFDLCRYFRSAVLRLQ